VAARFCQCRHVRRQLAAQCGAGGLVISEGRGKKVGDLARPLEHLALVVRAVLHLESCGNGCRLRFGEIRSARLGEIAERKKLEAVAVRTDLLIDLEAALQLGRIIETERARKRPALARRGVRFLRRGSAGAGERARERQSKSKPVMTLHRSGSFKPSRPEEAPMLRPERRGGAPIRRSNSAPVWLSRTVLGAAGSRKRMRNSRE